MYTCSSTGSITRRILWTTLLGGARHHGERTLGGAHALGADRLAVARTQAREAELADPAPRLEHVEGLADERNAPAAGAVVAAGRHGGEAATEDERGDFARHKTVFGARPAKPSARS